MRTRIFAVLVLACGTTGLAPVFAQAQESEHYVLRATTPALAFAAETEHYSMNATVGEPLGGALESTLYAIEIGFVTSGDGDGDGVVGSLDLCPGQYAGCNDQNGDGCIDLPDVDADGDGIGRGACDCDDANGQIWSQPGEVQSVRFDSGTVIVWSAPTDPGGSQPRYDVIRSSNPSDFTTSASCVEGDDASGTTATDPAVPFVGTAFYYLIRAENGCATGIGPLGVSSGVYARTARGCP